MQLQDRMDDVDREVISSARAPSSILEAVWAGTYDSWDIQRNRLRDLYDAGHRYDFY